MYVLLFLGAAALTALFMPLAKLVGTKIGAIDLPNEARKIHKRAVVRFGGMAIFISVMLSIVYVVFLSGIYLPEGKGHQLLGIVIAGVIIFIVGAIDDCRNLPAKVKLLAQVCCAAIAVLFGNRIDLITFDSDSRWVLSTAISVIFTIFWIVGITNAINLIDGADGLAGGVVCIANVALCYIAVTNGYFFVGALIVAVAGAAAGFLPFNFYPAKLFMGDSGSMFLGFMISCLALLQPMKSASLITYIMVVMVLLIPLSDVLLAMCKRVIKGNSIMQADRNHLHHVLMRLGMGQRRIALYIYTITAMAGLDAIIYNKGLTVTAILMGILIFGQVFVISMQRSRNIDDPTERENQTEQEDKVN